MSQSLILDVKGEHTYSSEISGVPPGSLYLALNVNISRQNIIEPRRGYDFLDYALPLASDRPKKLFTWNSELFVHYGTTFAYYNPSSGFSSRGSLSAPSNAQSVRAVSATNKNLYLTSSQGLKKTDAIGTSLYAAGIPPSLNIDLSLSGAGTAIQDTKYVTYQYLIGRRDANNNTQFGAVSGRYTLYNNAGSTQNVLARCFLPDGLDTTYFVQLYKTKEASSSAATGEELQLCFETPISSTNLSDKYVDITDIIPDALVLGAYIYTAPSQGGITSSNAMPPLARDIAEFKTSMFYAYVEGKQSLIFTLVSAGGSGLQNGDTVVVNDGATTETYTGGAAYNEGTNTFEIKTAGSPSQNIDDTIKSFIKLINKKSAIVYAFSLSQGATDLPGKVQLEARSLGAAAFTAVCAARPEAWQPQLTSPATVNNTSQNDRYKNGLMWSKGNQHEAVPKKYLAFVGASDDEIKRIMPLRDGLFIFKERDGAYVLRGDNESSFSISVLDITAKLIAPDSLVAVNNAIYGLFENGICEVSDTGVSIISLPIQDQILPLFGNVLSNLKAYSFGIGSDTDGKYILSVPTASTDTATTKQIIFDVFGRTFCRWDFNLKCGLVNPTDAKLYLGGGDTHMIRKERKSFTYADYADYGNLCTIISFTGTTLSINHSADMARGDILYQESGATAYIQSVVSSMGIVIIDSEQDWDTGVATVIHLKAIHCKVQWNADFGGNAAGLKQYYEGSLIQQQAFQKEATLYFTSDVNPSEASITLESSSGNGAFGEFEFGEEVFGGEQAKSPERFGIPRGHAMCSQLSVRFENRVAWSDFQLTGLSLAFNPISTSVSR